MKRVTCIFIITMLLACAFPFPTLVSAENEATDLWDGSAAKDFAGGDGTESDPYRIENAEQLLDFSRFRRLSGISEYKAVIGRILSEELRQRLDILIRSILRGIIFDNYAFARGHHRN